VNWEAVGAVGEILGAMAVFASLIYLAIQIRAQIKQQRKQTIDNLTENWLSALETQTYPEVAAVFTKGLTGFDDLSLAERAQFSSISGRIFRITEAFYLSYKAGDLDDELWKGQNAMLDDIMTHSGIVKAWSYRKHWYTDAFQELVEQSIAAGRGRELFLDSPPGGGSN
jgi:hypothetical protein